MTEDQYKQIAVALRDLPECDQKANAIQIITNNFIVCDKSFDGFKFIQWCYVKHSELVSEQPSFVRKLVA